METHARGPESPSDRLDASTGRLPAVAGSYKYHSNPRSSVPRPPRQRLTGRQGLGVSVYTFTEPIAELYVNRGTWSVSGRVGRPSRPYQADQGARLSRRRAMGHTDANTKSPSKLRDEYGPAPWWSEDHLTAKEIADIWPVHPETVNDYISKYGIRGGSS